MPPTRAIAALLLTVTLAAAAACGGKVAVDRAAAGGTGGAGVDPALCSAYCDAQQAMGCLKDPSVCPFDCKQQLINVGTCAGALAALVDCVTHDPTATCTSTSCTAERTAFQTCVIPETCGDSAECKVGGGCACDNTCSGVMYKSDCTDFGDLGCTCFKNGQAIGTCQYQVPDPNKDHYLGCDLYLGCCAQLFATSQ
jgi:hypothetical protein